MIVFYGNITGVHGLRGEVELYFANMFSFASLPTLKNNMAVFLSDSLLEYKVLAIKSKPRAIVLSLDGINSIEEARKLRGTALYIETDDLPSLGDEEFYAAELIGFKIIDNMGDVYGEVINCYVAPANDVLDIKLLDETILSLPFIDHYFGSVSRNNKSIEIRDKTIVS